MIGASIPSENLLCTTKASVAACYAFGLEVLCGEAINAGPVPAWGGPFPRVRIEMVGRQELEAVWQLRGSTRLHERRYPSGRLVISIDHHPDIGYRISAPRYGHYVVAGGADQVIANLPRATSWRWQRLLFAQVLPLVSTLHGMVAFHASAVAIARRGFAFVAPSGTGKTSLAAHLLARGAALLTDDVAMLQTDASGLRVHAGAGMMALNSQERRAVRSGGRDPFGSAFGPTGGKKYYPAATLGAPAPLGALYFLERHSEVDRFAIIPSDADPQVLLSGAFLGYLSTSNHPLNLLDTCMRIVETTPVFRVCVPPDFGAANLADHVYAHAAAL
jgi:hypothetical protein